MSAADPRPTERPDSRSWPLPVSANSRGMQWQEVGRRLWRLVEPHILVVEWSAVGGRPRIPDEVVFDRLVLFLRAGCAWDVFDELCRGNGVSGRTCLAGSPSGATLGVFERVCNEL